VPLHSQNIDLLAPVAICHVVAAEIVHSQIEKTGEQNQQCVKRNVTFLAARMSLDGMFDTRDDDWSLERRASLAVVAEASDSVVFTSHN